MNQWHTCCFPDLPVKRVWMYFNESTPREAKFVKGINFRYLVGEGHHVTKGMLETGPRQSTGHSAPQILESFHGAFMVAGCACRFGFWNVDEAEGQKTGTVAVTFINFVYAEDLDFICNANIWVHQLQEGTCHRESIGAPLFMACAGDQISMISTIISIRRDYVHRQEFLTVNNTFKHISLHLENVSGQ